MDQNESIFELKLDDESQSHLSESARWAKLMAIVGFIFVGLFVLVGLVMMVGMSAAASAFGGTQFPAVFGIVYIALAGLYFFPTLYLFRFAKYSKTATETNDQETLRMGISNLKSMFKFMGIMTLVVLGLYAVIFVFAIVGGVMSWL